LGEAFDGEEALGWSNDAIQVVVMDIQMCLNGIQGTALIKRVSPP
jgi:DNA-binding NarL/FixJ family response regulator